MNVRNKVISIVMSFIIIFGTVSSSFANDKERINNINPLVVDGGIISAPMLATVSALAVGTGILIKNNDDIYDIGRLFYDYVQRNNELTWDFVQSSFLAGYTLVNDVVHVDKSFTDIVKGFFDSTFNFSSDVSLENIPVGGIPFKPDFLIIRPGTSITFGQYQVTLELTSPTHYDVQGMLSFYDDGVLKTSRRVNLSKHYYECIYLNTYNNTHNSLHYKSKNVDGEFTGSASLGTVIASQVPTTGSFPYSGGYDWDKVKDRENEESIALPIPGNLDSLVGQGSESFWENTDGLVGNGSISLPGVSNPSIGVTDDVFVSSPSTDVPGVDNPGIDKPGIVFPPFGGGLDFSPITQSSFVDKFPFSLAKDIKNIVSVFDVEPKAPKFTVPIVSEELDIDLTQFNVWASIIRFFVLIGFMIALINITRKVIG